MKSFKHREVYAQLKVAPPIIVRLDGVAFSRVLTRLGVQKPYDEVMREASAAVCHAFFTSGVFSPLVVYAFSDEFNVYLEHLPFDGRVEKLDSVAASLASSVFTSVFFQSFEFKPKEPLCFDARLIPLQREEVVDYLIWRQAECWRNCMNSYAFYTLVGEGMSNEQAAAHLAGKGAEQIHELLFERGINLAKAPPWQRRGMLAYKLKELVGGHGATKGAGMYAERARLKIEGAPLFSEPEGRGLVERALRVRD